MIRQTLALLLAWTLAAPAGQPSRKLSLKERLLEIPTGSIIEVRTQANEKIRGRLTETTNEGLSVQRFQNGKLETLAIAYSDVKSVKVTAAKEPPGGKAGKTAGWIILGGLAALGVLMLVGLIMMATGCH